MTDELAIWKPDAFKGTDLLPGCSGKRSGPSDVKVQHDQDIDASDITLPVISVLQGASDPVKDQLEGAIPGKLWCDWSQEVLEPPVRLLVIHRWRGYALFPRKNRPEHAGLERCISRDGVTGSVYGNCETCRKCIDWHDGIPPAGATTQQYLLWTDSTICLMRWQMTSKPIRDNHRTYVSLKEMTARNYFAHPTVLSVERASKDENTWFVPRLTWQQRIVVPDEIQRECDRWRGRIDEALELGKLSDAEDAPTPSSETGTGESSQRTEPQEFDDRIPF